MKPMRYLDKTHAFSTHLAIASFLVGTILLLLFKCTPDVSIALIGIGYLMLAIVLNLAMLVNLLFYFLTYRARRDVFAVKMLIVLSNIPIAFFYFLIVANHF